MKENFHRIAILQKGGDFREAWTRIKKGEEEYYQGQFYSVRMVEKASTNVAELATICCYCEDVYDELLAPKVRAIGLGMNHRTTTNKENQDITSFLSRYNPDKIIMRTPICHIIKWARKNHIAISLMLADSFQNTNLHSCYKNSLISAEINNPNVRWASNHGTAASRSLQAIGVHPKKILPWEWPAFNTPEEIMPKHWQFKTRLLLFYIGSLTVTKGVMDCIEALACLKNSGINSEFHIYGDGETKTCQHLAEKMKLSDSVHFHGKIANASVIQKMNQADIVVVPSRHEYAEGFPKTIKEALCSRTPLVVSDHPVFTQYLEDRESAMIFKAGSPSSLAEKILELIKDPLLYRKMSKAALPTWQKLQLPVTWGELLVRLVRENPEDQAWLTAYSLDSNLYNINRKSNPQ